MNGLCDINRWTEGLMRVITMGPIGSKKKESHQHTINTNQKHNDGFDEGDIIRKMLNINYSSKVVNRGNL